MTNNPNNNNNNSNLQDKITSLLGNNPQIGDDVKKLINTLTEEDIKKISSLMKSQELQAIASSIIESKNKKGNRNG